MKTAKIIQREITDKNLGVTYTLLEMRKGKRGRGKVLKSQKVYNDPPTTLKHLYELNGFSFCHSSMTLALRWFYRYALENNIRLV